MPERVEPTAEQIKALSSPLRLRILRLCGDEEWTNKELADRLDRDPSTILHHVRLLLAAGLLEPGEPRKGTNGAYEKPYRSTGLSWYLDFSKVDQQGDPAGEAAMFGAFRDELAEAGYESIVELDRFYFHLDDATLAAFGDRVRELLNEFLADDAARKKKGAPTYGGMIALHRMASGPKRARRRGARSTPPA